MEEILKESDHPIFSSELTGPSRKTELARLLVPELHGKTSASLESQVIVESCVSAST